MNKLLVTTGIALFALSLNVSAQETTGATGGGDSKQMLKKQVMDKKTKEYNDTGKTKFGRTQFERVGPAADRTAKVTRGDKSATITKDDKGVKKIVTKNKGTFVREDKAATPAAPVSSGKPMPAAKK